MEDDNENFETDYSEDGVMNNFRNFNMPNIFGKDATDILPFAQLLFREELTGTGLEGWDCGGALKLFGKFVDGFKELDIQTKPSREVLEECHSALDDALKNMSAQEKFEKDYSAHYTEAQDVYNLFKEEEQFRKETRVLNQLAQEAYRRACAAHTEAYTQYNKKVLGHNFSVDTVVSLENSFIRNKK
ncbi:MAG: hypothetical protein LBC30_02895 [Puniceicoccales bacterium]|jgi:hypothetical protein|nr:hypothetical protein [Puniceicoccales bacterium]